MERAARDGPNPSRSQTDRSREAEVHGFDRNPNWNLTLVSSCHERALLTARKVQPSVPDLVALETVTKACEWLACYCGVYTQYLIRLLTKGALPDRNDSGDIELFLHAIDDDHIVVTSEKKWKTMADLAGFGHRVRMAR
jgi:hypothetical protein